jgi:DNA-binding FadR family transcriptional regulator
MIFHGGHVDLAVIVELLEVVHPLVFEMARLALMRSTDQQIEKLRALSAQMADAQRDEESRAAAVRELVVAVADMTGNRVWQMLARRLRALLASQPMRETRLRIPKDHARMAAFVDDCIDHHIAGHADKALSALRRALEYLGEGFDLPENRKPRMGASKR